MLLKWVFQSAHAWFAYAVVEYAFATVFPLLASSSAILGGWHSGVNIRLVIIYCLLGALAGAVAGAVVWLSARARRVQSSDERVASARRKAACTGLLMIAVIAAIASSGSGWYRSPALLYHALLIAVLLISFLSGRWPWLMRVLGNPWSVSLLMLVPTWVGHDWLVESPLMLRSAASLAVALMIVLGSLRVATAAGRPLRAAVGALAAAVLVFAIASLISRSRQDLPSAVARTRPASAGVQPNVVLIVLDTVRADHLSVYGYARPTTPSLEALAREATVYRHAAATSDVTLSSHASLFTGLYASAHKAHTGDGIGFLGRPLAGSFPTLAAGLAAAGYWTTAVVANFGYLGDYFGLMRGFDHVNALAPLMATTKVTPLRRALRHLLARLYNLRDYDRQSRTAGEINRDAFRILQESRRSGGPFFLFLNYMDAHAPYIPPAPYHQRFPGFDPAATHADFGRAVSQVMGLNRSLTETERAHIVSQYDGSLAYLDYHLGRLFQQLKDLGLYDKTLIVVTSDHGEAFGNRNLMEHAGVSVYQDQIHIPLIVKYPDSEHRGSVDGIVSLVDVFPTVCDVLDLRPPPVMHGRTLLTASAQTDRLIVAESFPHEIWRPLHRRFRRLERAGFSGPWKVIVSSSGKREIYRWRDDAAERNDLYATAPEAKTLVGRLTLWTAGIASGPHPGPSTPLNKETLDRMRSLGYVQ